MTMRQEFKVDHGCLRKPSICLIHSANEKGKFRKHLAVKVTKDTQTMKKKCFSSLFLSGVQPSSHRTRREFRGESFKIYRIGEEEDLQNLGMRWNRRSLKARRKEIKSARLLRNYCDVPCVLKRPWRLHHACPKKKEESTR